MSIKQEPEETLSSGRLPRRSAAAGKKAWAPLMKHGKGDDYDEEYNESPRSSTRKKRKVDKTPEPAPAPATPQPKTNKPASSNEGNSTPKSMEEAPKLKAERSSQPTTTSEKSPAKQQPVVKQSDSVPMESDKPASPRMVPPIPVPQTVKTPQLMNGSKTGAPGKEQIDNIQKAMTRTYMDDYDSADDFDDDFDDEEDIGAYAEDDIGDFIEKPRRSYTKRVTPATASSTAAKPRGGIVSTIRTPSSFKPSIGSYAQPVAGNQVMAPRILARPGNQPLKYASSANYVTGDNRPNKIVLLRGTPTQVLSSNWYANYKAQPANQYSSPEEVGNTTPSLYSTVFSTGETLSSNNDTIIHCSCKTQCCTIRCKCRKNNQACTSRCHKENTSCTNSPPDKATADGKFAGNGDGANMPQTISSSTYKLAPVAAQDDLKRKIEEKQLRVLELQEVNLYRQNAYLKMKIQEKAEEKNLSKEEVDELLDPKPASTS